LVSPKTLQLTDEGVKKVGSHSKNEQGAPHFLSRISRAGCWRMGVLNGVGVGPDDIAVKFGYDLAKK
jgi:hypothetical protein